MKKRNLVVFLAALGLLLVGCNNNNASTPGGDNPPVDPVTKYTISFDANGGSGKVADVEMEKGEFTLPENPFTAPAGKEFAGWKVDGAGDLLQPGAKININANTKLVAQWKDAASEAITHLDPFVRSLENPSQTRAFNADFDVMVEDFSGATSSGEFGKGGALAQSHLRVLVDSQDQNEPTSPDAAIYKMATGSYEIHNFEGIGFKIRKLAGGSLNLSNLVLGLRGDDSFKVFEINLAEAVNPDGEALSELSEEYQDLVVCPGQSIEDANTVYKLLDGGDSEVKVLDKILGFHLYALNEECAAIVEIEEVYLINAGEKTVLDSFDRERVGQTDPTCWWRDSTGFIMQRGAYLFNGGTYSTAAIELGDYENVVVNLTGDSSRLTVNGIEFSTLKDAAGANVTGAVNGGYYSYVINLANSELLLANGTLFFESTDEVSVASIFLTNLQDEYPATDYPKIDIDGASYVTDFNFTVAKGTVKTNYDDAILDTRVTDAGLNYLISYNHGSEVEIGDGKLTITGGNYDYVNLVIGSNADFAKKYLVFAIEAGANLNDFRIKCGQSEVFYANQWLAGAGLPSIPEIPSNYPYVTNGYNLYIIDLERTGFQAINNEVQMWYTGGTDIVIDSIFFADEFKAETKVKIEELDTFEVGAGDGYQYVGSVNAAGLDYLMIETTATPDNLLRFGLGDQAKWLNSGLIDVDGNTIPGDATSFVLDLKANNIALDGTTFHIHSNMSAAAFTLKVCSYELIPSNEEKMDLLLEASVDAGEGYAYVGNFDAAGVQFVKVSTIADETNELRFGLGDQAKWLKNGDLIDNTGKVIPADATNFIIDIAASGIALDGTTLHVHSTKSSNAFVIMVFSYELVPATIVEELNEASFTVEAGEGYGYVGNVNVGEGNVVLIKTTATSENLLRFGVGDQAKWLNSGSIIDEDGKVVADGSGKFTIDLAASGIVLDNGYFHIHSEKGATSFTVEVTVYRILEVGDYPYLLSFYRG